MSTPSTFYGNSADDYYFIINNKGKKVFYTLLYNRQVKRTIIPESIREDIPQREFDGELDKLAKVWEKRNKLQASLEATIDQLVTCELQLQRSGKCEKEIREYHIQRAAQKQEDREEAKRRQQVRNPSYLGYYRHIYNVDIPVVEDTEDILVKSEEALKLGVETLTKGEEALKLGAETLTKVRQYSE